MTEAITTFDDIEYQPLRDYNRCVMLFNIREDSGMDAAQAYLEKFSKNDIKRMLDLYHMVKKLGAVRVKQEIIKAMPLPEEEEIIG